MKRSKGSQPPAAAMAAAMRRASGEEAGSGRSNTSFEPASAIGPPALLVPDRVPPRSGDPEARAVRPGVDHNPADSLCRTPAVMSDLPQRLHALGPAAGRTGRPALRSVVGITDIAVERAPVGYLAYTVAKGALQTLLLALANEWAPHVRVNIVQPGTLPFPPDWNDPDRTRRILASIPLGRIGSFEELAAVVAFLALDASYVTGQVLAVDGGRSRRLD